MWTVETLPYKLTVTKLANLVLEETLLAKQTIKDKSEISMKMKIILIAIIASCYSAPQIAYKLLPQVQKQTSPQGQWHFGMKLEKIFHDGKK